MIIKGFKIESCGSESEIAARAELLNQYTGTLEYDNKIIGVKPVSAQEPDKLVVHWSLSVIVKGEHTSYTFVDAYRGELQERFNFKPEDDIDVKLSELGFKRL